MLRPTTNTTFTAADDAALRTHHDRGGDGRGDSFVRAGHNGDGAAIAEAPGHREGAGGPPTARKGEVDTATLCRLLSLLADKTRLRILWLLSDGERAVGNMTNELGLPQPTVSHHLAWLRTMHLVSPRRAGKNVFYALGKAARGEQDGSLSLLTGDTLVTIARRPGE